MFIFHFTKQPNLAGTSLYALIIRVSRDLRYYFITEDTMEKASHFIRKDCLQT
jgi:hypothetical protein